jgi:hypothetical protein
MSQARVLKRLYHLMNEPFANFKHTDKSIGKNVYEPYFNFYLSHNLAYVLGNSNLLLATRDGYKFMDEYLYSMNKYIALFLTTIINREQYKYSYGRKCSQVKLKRSRIKLPVTPEGTPDWQFMENYIKSLPYSKNIAPSQPNEIIDEMMEVKKEIISLRKQLQSQQAAQVVNYGTININDNSKNIKF